MRTTVQREKRLIRLLRKLQKSRMDNVQKLICRLYTELKELEKRYFEAYQDQEEEGETLSAKVLWEKYKQVDEAIIVKIRQ